MPASRLPWFKLWPEAVDHEKLADLSDSECWTWIVALSRASVQPKRWRFSSINHAAKVTGRKVAHIKALVRVGLLDEEEDGLWIHDWNDWQKWRAEDASNDSRTTPDQLANDSSNNSPTTLERPHEQLAPSTREPRTQNPEGELPPAPPTSEHPPAGGPRRKPRAIDDAFLAEMAAEYGPQLGGEHRARDSIELALNHKALDKAKDKRLYLRGWLRRDAERFNEHAKTDHGRGGNRASGAHTGNGKAEGWVERIPDVVRERAERIRRGEDDGVLPVPGQGLAAP